MASLRDFEPNKFARMLMQRRLMAIVEPSEQERAVLREMLRYRDRALEQINLLKNFTNEEKNMVMSVSAQQRLTEIEVSLAKESEKYAKSMVRSVKSAKEAYWGRGQDDVLVSLEAANVANINYTQFPEAAVKAMISKPVLGSDPNEVFKGVFSDTTKVIQNDLTQGMVGGESFFDMHRRLRDDLNMEAAQAMRITRTNVVAAYNEGSVAAYDENADIIAGYEWCSVLDSHTSRICAALHKQRIKLGETFPGGFTAPPAHPNCRSTTIPIFYNDDMNKELDKAHKSAKEEYVTPEGIIKNRNVELDFDVEYEKWLKDQPELTQENVLGSRYKFEKWKEDEITIPDVLRNDMSTKTDEEVKQMLEERGISSPVTITAPPPVESTPMSDVTGEPNIETQPEPVVSNTPPPAATDEYEMEVQRIENMQAGSTEQITAIMHMDSEYISNLTSSQAERLYEIANANVATTPQLRDVHHLLVRQTSVEANRIGNRVFSSPWMDGPTVDLSKIDQPVPQFTKVKDLNKYMEKLIPGVKVKLNGLDLDAATAYSEELRKQVAARPELFTTFVTFDTVKDEAYYAMVWGGSSMHINASKMGKLTDLEARLKRDVAAKFHPIGAEKAVSVVTHESAHLMDAGIMSNEPAAHVSKARSDFKMDLEKWKTKYKKDAAKISKYAATNREELYAEAFTSLQFTPEQLQHESVKELKKLFDKHTVKIRKAYLGRFYKDG
jgi:SPP1 gp7 family putative phage head morphogenesis protein